MTGKAKSVEPHALVSRLVPWLAAIAILSLVEAGLIFAGFLPPVLSYSPGNILFILAKLTVIAYCAVTLAGGSLKESAAAGAAFGFVSSATLALAAFASKSLSNHPILGMSIPSGYLPAVFGSLVVGNLVAGAIVSVAVTFAKNLILGRK